MRSFKSVVGLLAALLPLGYCGYLLLYFRGVSGDIGPVQSGLGPTMLGLGAVGLLFAVPLVLKLVRLLATPSAGSREPRLEESTFDADAALARYLARKAEGGVEVPPPPGGFGRKIV